MREHVGQCQCSATESKNKAAKPSPIKSGELVRAPDNKLTRRTNARPSVSPFLAISDDESNPSGVGEQANTVDNGDQKGSPSLRFYVDNSAWDVIHEEVMDWRDSSWSSMHLPESRMYFTLCLPTWDPKQSALRIEDGEPRLQVVVQMIAVQLLASCFSVPQDMKTLTLPSGWYCQNRQIGTASRLVSSLRQHTQWNHSPAFGYHARNNSAESLCSTAVCETSREAHLAEHVSRNRLLRQTRRPGKKVTTRRRDRRVDHRDGNLSGHCSFPLHLREGLRSTIWSASSQRLPPKGRRSQPQSPGQDQLVHETWALPLREGGHANRSSSLEPTLHSEGPPVFIQPIKQYVLKRWRTFCARNRHSSPTSASGEWAGRSNFSTSDLGRSSKRQLKYHRNASSISRASVQLNRRYPILTIFQGSGSSVGMPPSEPTIESFETPLEIVSSATTEQRSQNFNTVAQADSHDYLEESAIMLPTPQQKDEAHGNADGPSSYFQSQVPQESLGTLEAGQTRHRASTSGTTIYHPPLIAEASPDSRKLNSDSSSSTVTAGGRPFLLL